MRIARNGVPILAEYELERIADVFMKLKRTSAYRLHGIQLDGFAKEFGEDVLSEHLSCISKKWEKQNYPDDKVRGLQPEGRLTPCFYFEKNHK